MAECRYNGNCCVMYHRPFDSDELPCDGYDEDICSLYEPMPDVDALLALADEMEFDGARALDDGDWCKPLLVEYAHRIREALGAQDGR